MPKTKAVAERQQKPPPAPTEKWRLERPGKAAGPQRTTAPFAGQGDGEVPARRDADRGRRSRQHNRHALALVQPHARQRRRR